MTEFETKLLKILEETNVHICNVHNELHTLDNTLERTIDAISNVGGNVDTSYLCELSKLNMITFLIGLNGLKTVLIQIKVESDRMDMNRIQLKFQRALNTAGSE